MRHPGVPGRFSILGLCKICLGSPSELLTVQGEHRNELCFYTWIGVFVLTMYFMALVFQERRPERVDQVGVLAEGAPVRNKQLQLR
jgi:hypothetical protein